MNTNQLIKGKISFLDIFMKIWGSGYYVCYDTMTLSKWTPMYRLLEGYTSCGQQFLLGLLRRTNDTFYSPVCCICAFIVHAI